MLCEIFFFFFFCTYAEAAFGNRSLIMPVSAETIN